MDKRVTPARPDLAASHLTGKVDAERFVDGTPMQVKSPVVPLRRTPAADGAQETQLLYGEEVTVYEEKDGWCWVQAKLDDYVGYVAASDLSAEVITLTHRVTAVATYLYTEPDLKSAPLARLTMNAKIQAGADAGDKYVRESNGGWVFIGHIAPLAESVKKPVPIARMYLDVPYFWGGRSSLGLDCSGLIQAVMERRGILVPRDTDQQEAWCRENGAERVFLREKDSDDWTGLALREGDILFWKGHVAMMVDTEDMIHANATAMCVSIDEAREFSGKVSAEAGPVQSIYRI